MTSTEENSSARKKLVVKISLKGFRFNSDKHTHESFGKENKNLNVNTSEKLLVQGLGKKRVHEEIECGPIVKKRKNEYFIANPANSSLHCKSQAISRGSNIAKPAISSVDSKSRAISRRSSIPKPANSSVHCKSQAYSSRSSIPKSVISSRAFSSGSSITKPGNSSVESKIKGAKSVVEDNVRVKSPSSVCGTTTVFYEGFVDFRLSPKHAQRAAMLKSRYADIIAKAKQHTLLDQCIKKREDPVEKQVKEKERKKKAKIASEREAARFAFEHMKRSVEIDDNLNYFNQLQRLMKYSPLGVLERFGLYRKDDFLEEDDFYSLNEDLEEGEIL